MISTELRIAKEPVKKNINNIQNMNIKIIKTNNNDYTLELQSGHFKGTLESIPETSIDNLIESLKSAKEGNEKMIRVWNPRAKRHEMVLESTVKN